MNYFDDIDKKRMHVVSGDREERAVRILKMEAGWDGKFPIPVYYFGSTKLNDSVVNEIDVLHCSGDDKCLWVGTAVSALLLFFRGHDLVKDEKILAKRATFPRSENFSHEEDV